jgi:hypothetical protein
MKRGQFLRGASLGLATTTGAAMLVTLIVTTAAPTLGQTATQAAGPTGSGNQSAAPVPDLSGFWGHFSLPSFEPPLGGPGLILNKSRVRQVFGNNGRPLPPGTGPLASSLFQFVGDYSNPILNPEAADAVKKHGEIELSGIPAPIPSNQCWPGGLPYVFINVGMQMMSSPPDDENDKRRFGYNRDKRNDCVQVLIALRRTRPSPSHSAATSYERRAAAKDAIYFAPICVPRIRQSCGSSTSSSWSRSRISRMTCSSVRFFTS